MQEVEGPVLHQNYDYEQLQGQTGPLVYPAGFVYLFALLRAATQEGTDIFRAQLIFSVIHTALLSIVLFSIYANSPVVPKFALPIVVLSRRAHSIFELRLFNDGVAMLFAYMAIAMGMKNRWTLCCILFSLGVSIKMNVLLMAPGLAVLLVQANGIVGFVWRVALCGLIQLILAWPFLQVNALGYLKRSFDLGRVFLKEWTVNFKFLEEDTFQALGPMLLLCTLVVWLVFGEYRWSQHGLLQMLSRGSSNKLSPGHVATVMLESNLIGIVFARSLHYQFYAWYVHSLPFLVWRGWIGHHLPGAVCVAVLFGVEVCFNVFPATPMSSAVLQFLHVMLLLSAWLSPKPEPFGEKQD